ncbi:hypothetical protein AD998_13680 [bacterium 336/3]|nr:hypothetical protein AD998_13680 [bacterium 336/3]
METLQEIALFLDTPVFLIQEGKSLLSDTINTQTELLFIFENTTDKDFKNKQGERVLDKLMQALVAKYPTLSDIPKTEIVAEKNMDWNFSDTNLKKVIVFSEKIAKQLSLQNPVYQIFEQKNISFVISKPLEMIETQVEEKKTLWNTLLQFFEG